MGVHDLNEIIKKYGIAQKSNKYLAGIIDGNNLLFIRIQRAISEMYKSRPMNIFEGVNMDLVNQLKTLVTNVVKDCGSTIKQLITKDNCLSIYLVFDPSHTPHYKITSEMKYTDSKFIKDTELQTRLLQDKS